MLPSTPRYGLLKNIEATAVNRSIYKGTIAPPVITAVRRTRLIEPRSARRHPPCGPQSHETLHRNKRFSYKQWKGPFYPESLPDNLMLHFYGEHYPTVEINNTFYRMPKLDLLKSWARQVPDDFRFVFKTCKDCKTWKSPWKGRGTAPGPLLLSPFGPLSDP